MEGTPMQHFYGINVQVLKKGHKIKYFKINYTCHPFIQSRDYSGFEVVAGN